MSGFFNKYPYTDFHELNLDWLLQEFKKLMDEYQFIIDWIHNDARNYNDLLGRIVTLENKTAQLQRQLNEQYIQITDEYTALYSSIITQVDSTLASMWLKIEDYKLDLENEIIAGDNAIFSWVEARLQTFIDSLPDYEQLIIYNPVRGEMTNVQTAINDLYSYFNVYALTAQQYDDLQLTAQQYDDHQITAHDYDTMGVEILGRGIFTMRSPFTGKFAPVSEVVNMLFDLHRTSALTASAYDALDLTATAYDALDLGAYDYDMNGI